MLGREAVPKTWAAIHPISLFDGYNHNGPCDVNAREDRGDYDQRPDETSGVFSDELRTLVDRLE